MPLREFRKIHSTGGSLAITLPLGWLRYFKLMAGDEVEIIANGELRIRPIKKATTKTTGGPSGRYGQLDPGDSAAGGNCPEGVGLNGDE
jgi:bifunctional DNA-binding transcriptional regulator/antitoxin component of YhaV-PrlF toxin-antitoxin module